MNPPINLKTMLKESKKLIILWCAKAETTVHKQQSNFHQNQNNKMTCKTWILKNNQKVVSWSRIKTQMPLMICNLTWEVIWLRLDLKLMICNQKVVIWWRIKIQMPSTICNLTQEVTWLKQDQKWMTCNQKQAIWSKEENKRTYLLIWCPNKLDKIESLLLEINQAEVIW